MKLAYEVFRRWHAHMLADAAANKRRQYEQEASRRARILAARSLLLRDGTLRRVARVRRALRTEVFHDRFMSKDRARARDLEQLCGMAVEALFEMGVDLTDVQLTMRRAENNQLKFRPLPTYEAGRRALAVVDGQEVADVGGTLDELLAGAAASAAASGGGATHLGQGTSGR